MNFISFCILSSMAFGILGYTMETFMDIKAPVFYAVYGVIYGALLSKGLSSYFD